MVSTELRFQTSVFQVISESTLGFFLQKKKKRKINFSVKYIVHRFNFESSEMSGGKCRNPAIAFLLVCMFSPYH